MREAKVERLQFKASPGKKKKKRERERSTRLT
jgi:hypothetical protein